MSRNSESMASQQEQESSDRGFREAVLGKCQVQTCEDRFGEGASKVIRQHEQDHMNPSDAETFVQGLPVGQIITGAEQQDGASSQIPLEKKIPKMPYWRNNLTALSQRYNLYFAAYENRTFVYQPKNATKQSLPQEPNLILATKPDRVAIHISGTLDGRFHHQANHIATGFLGAEEILVSVYDDGSVFAYYIKHIADYVEQTSSGCRTQPSVPTYFFSENVGKSAWGIAVHQESRLIAVSSNRFEVTVFAFGLSRLPEAMDCRVRPIDYCERSVLKRKRNWRIVIPLGEGGNNIPNISFWDDDEGFAEKVVAIDIMGTVWILDIWKSGTAALKVSHRANGSRRWNIRQPRGWGVAVIPYESFLPAHTATDMLGLEKTDIMEAKFPHTGEWVEIQKGLLKMRNHPADISPNMPMPENFAPPHILEGDWLLAHEQPGFFPTIVNGDQPLLTIPMTGPGLALPVPVTMPAQLFPAAPPLPPADEDEDDGDDDNGEEDNDDDNGDDDDDEFESEYEQGFPPALILDHISDNGNDGGGGNGGDDNEDEFEPNYEQGFPPALILNHAGDDESSNGAANNIPPAMDDGESSDSSGEEDENDENEGGAANDAVAIDLNAMFPINLVVLNAEDDVSVYTDEATHASAGHFGPAEVMTQVLPPDGTISFFRSCTNNHDLSSFQSSWFDMVYYPHEGKTYMSPTSLFGRLQFHRREKIRNYNTLDQDRDKLDELGSRCCILRTYEKDIEMRSINRDDGAAVFCQDPILWDHPPHPLLQHADRLNMIVHIPELSLVVIGSAIGRVVLLTPTRSPDGLRGFGFVVKQGYRIDWVLPTRSDEEAGLRPSRGLYGIAVGPVQEGGAPGCLLRADGAPAPSPASRRYRLMLHYRDHRILSYIISRDEKNEQILIF